MSWPQALVICVAIVAGATVIVFSLLGLMEALPWQLQESDDEEPGK